MQTPTEPARRMMNSNSHPKSSRAVLIAVSPKSGTGAANHLTSELHQALLHRGFESQVITSIDHLKSEVKRLLALNRLEAVVSAGGDGTVSLLANVLPACVSILIFPLGTENLLAKYWGITNNVEFACGILDGGRVVHMDVGSANGKLFLVMLSCGFDAEVVQRMHAHRKGHIYRWTYAAPILKSLASYGFPMMSYEQPGTGRKQFQPVPWLFLFNVPRYAANLQICPEADPTDGRLDLCTFQGAGILPGFYYLIQAWRGTHGRMREFRHEQVRSLSIFPSDETERIHKEIPFQIDGDPGGVLPLHVEIHPGRIKLLIPETTATSDPIPSMSMAAT